MNSDHLSMPAQVAEYPLSLRHFFLTTFLSYSQAMRMRAGTNVFRLFKSNRSLLLGPLLCLYRVSLHVNVLARIRPL